MLHAALNKFRKKTPLPLDDWKHKLEYIRNKWDGTPVEIKTYIFRDISGFKANFPKTTSNKKELHIAVFPWTSNGSDIIGVTKPDNITLEYPLHNTSFSKLKDVQLADMGLIPKDPYCNICNEFSVSIDKDGNCPDCRK